jgi:hypothetical protein
VWASAVEGTAWALIVGYSGTPGWRLVRVAAVVTVFALLLYLQGSGCRWVAGAAAVFAGLLGAVTGVAVGLTHLVKSGAPLPVLAGMVCLAAGLALLVSGSQSLIRLLKRWWRLLAIPAVYVVFAVRSLPRDVRDLCRQCPARESRFGIARTARHGIRNGVFPGLG